MASSRYIDTLQKHMEQSVLSKLPFGYQSMLRQATSSEEDDMSILNACTVHTYQECSMLPLICVY